MRNDGRQGTVPIFPSLKTDLVQDIGLQFDGLPGSLPQLAIGITTCHQEINPKVIKSRQLTTLTHKGLASIHQFFHH